VKEDKHLVKLSTYHTIYHHDRLHKMKQSASEMMNLYKVVDCDMTKIYEDFKRDTSMIIREFESHVKMHDHMRYHTEIGQCCIGFYWHPTLIAPKIRTSDVKQEDGSFKKIHNIISDEPDYSTCTFAIGYQIINFYALEAGIPVALDKFKCIIYPISRSARVKGDFTRYNED
jgi:hypothetical protein